MGLLGGGGSGKKAQAQDAAPPPSISPGTVVIKVSGLEASDMPETEAWGK